jgi:hypothetical protein
MWQKPPDGMEVRFQNPMVRLLASESGDLSVEHDDGYFRELDEEENNYLYAALGTAYRSGLPVEEGYPDHVAEYLFQVCLALRVKGNEAWQLVFRTVPPDEMGRMIADEYMRNEGNKP